MDFEQLPLAGAFVVSAEPHHDERGSFARIWASEEMTTRGLASSTAESSLSHTPRRGTLRGLHYQVAPHAECKFVTCVRGAIWDVILDMRSDSPTYRKWHGIILDASDLRSLYIPEGFAHGFLTMSDDVVILYHINEPYDLSCARGVRWDDPMIGIEWPMAPVLVGARDRSFPSILDDSTSR